MRAPRNADPDATALHLHKPASVIWSNVVARPRFEKEVAGWLRSGELVHHEDVVDGLDAAPEAFLGMLAGEHLGKRLVRVAPDPTLR